MKKHIAELKSIVTRLEAIDCELDELVGDRDETFEMMGAMATTLDSLELFIGLLESLEV